MKLKKLSLRGYCGLTTDEEWGQRVVLTGRNGSGKTARMRAVRWLLLGPERDGFLKFASHDAPAIRGVFEGLTVSRSARISDGKLKNLGRVDPSRGEKTLAEIQARVTRELDPSIFALNLDQWMQGSPLSRRKELLNLLRADEVAQDALDDTFAPWRTSTVLADVIEFIEQRAPGAGGMERLHLMLDATRERKNEYRRRHGEALDALRKLEIEAERVDLHRSRDVVEAEVAALDSEIEAASRAIGEQRLRDRELKRIAKEIEELRAEVAESLNPLAELLEVEEAIDPQATERLGESVAGLLAGAEALVKEIEGEAREHQAEQERITLAYASAKAYREALEKAAAVGASFDCAKCGERNTPSFRTEIEEAKAAEEESETCLLAHADMKTGIDERWREAHRDLYLWSDYGQKVTNASRAWDAIGELQKARQAHTMDAVEIMPAETLSARKEERAKLRALLEDYKAREVLAKKRVQFDTEVNELGKRVHECGELMVCLQDVMSDVLKTLVRPLGELLDDFYRDLPEKLYLSLVDHRDKPDASLWLADGDKRIPWESMSSGQKAYAMAAFASALTAIDMGKSYIFIEAGEIDSETLGDLLDHLLKVEAEMIVVATHVYVPDDVNTGWQFVYTSERG
jgi:hypothetical protein